MPPRAPAQTVSSSAATDETVVDSIAPGAPSGMRRVTAASPGSICTTSPNPPVAAHSDPAPNARSMAGSPMPVVRVTRRVVPLTSEIVPSRASPTQAPRSSATTEVGFEPVATEATTSFVAGSITTTPGSVTATPPPPESRVSARADHGGHDERHGDRGQRSTRAAAADPRVADGRRHVGWRGGGLAGGAAERRVLIQDRPVGPRELGARVDAELGGEGPRRPRS